MRLALKGLLGVLGSRGIGVSGSGFKAVLGSRVLGLGLFKAS